MPSKAWDYFVKNDKYSAECKLCKVVIRTCGNTTNLRTHLLSKHPNTIEPADGNNDQPTIVAAVKELKSLKDGDRAKMIDMKILWFIINNFQPFNVVDSKDFKNLIKILSPQYLVPSRFKITKLCHDLYVSKKDLIKTHLHMIDWVALSCDGWTDTLNTRSYLGVTCHYIDDYVCQSLCLSVKEMTTSHSSANIIDNIIDILDNFEIEKDKIVSVVSDGAANMVSAVKKIVDEPIWCVAHKLALVVNDSLKDCAVISELIQQVRAIVKFSKQSNNVSDLIRQLQVDDDVTPLKLMQDVVTRWNSTYLMLERYMKLRNIVSMALIKVNREDLDVPFDKCYTISDIISLLEPFYQVTLDISGEEYVTISRIIPVISMLKHAITSEKPATELGRKLQGILCKHVDERFRAIERSKIFAYATLLDPRFKKTGFFFAI